MESPSRHEVKLVEATIDSSFNRYAPDKLVGDKAYSSDSLDRQLFKERGIEMIAPHRRSRKKSSTQDGGKPGVIGADEKLSVYLPGFKTLDVWLFDTNTMQRISLVWFNLVALLYYFVFFEMRSNNPNM